VQETGFFRGWGGSWDTPYGQFFLSWYSGALIAHGERMVRMATAIFNTLHPQRCTLSNHLNSSQSIINAGPLYTSPRGAQVSSNAVHLALSCSVHGLPSCAGHMMLPAMAGNVRYL
jgi:hypothetical protein